MLIRIFLIAFALNTVVALASAAIISVDSEFGTNSITRDTEQGLDFLDLTYSLDRSYNDISTQFGTGGDFEGFRYASLTEVVRLINNHGFSPEVTTATNFGYATHYGDDDQLSEFVSLVGITRSDLSGQRSSTGITGSGADSNNRILVTLRDYLAIDEDDRVEMTPYGNISSGDINGSWLVRESSVIPEPSSCVLFAGLITCFGLAGWWRKRRKAA